MERKVLTASDGMVLTDGKTYGKIIYLAEGADASAWHEIPEEEYMNDTEITAEEALKIITEGADNDEE
jgi:hypothetical protein